MVQLPVAGMPLMSGIASGTLLPSQIVTYMAATATAVDTGTLAPFL
jgi:hypothetical protein